MKEKIEFERLVKSEIKKIVNEYYNGEIEDSQRMIEDLSFNSMRYLLLLTQVNILANVDMFEASDYIDKMDTVSSTIEILDRYREGSIVNE